jgi:2-oxoglutarate ferredoxin oxidoreductase subunit alpha
MADFVKLGFELAEKYRNPAMILSDGMIGQMMEKVTFFDQMPRKDNTDQDWVATGKPPDRERNVVTSLDLDPLQMEQHNKDMVEKYNRMQQDEVRFESIACEDAECLMVAYGSSARICEKAVKLSRDQGIKAGLLRPITLFPFPKMELHRLAQRVKFMLSVELSAGQMIEDVKLSVEGHVPVVHFGRMGGAIHTPDEILSELKRLVKEIG